MFKSNLNETSSGRYESKEQKSALENIKLLYKSREVVIKSFNDYSSIVSEAKYKSIHGGELKILTPKQMCQRLTKVLAQVKAGNTYENLLKEIGQIIYSFYSVKLLSRMDTIFMNSRNSKTSDPYRLLLNSFG